MSVVNAADEPPVESRERILQVANRLFIEQGYHRLSMRNIAESAGISKAGIYHHFKDKETLFLAILTGHLDKLEAIIMAAEQDNGPVQDKVRLMVRSILTQAPNQRAIIRLASQEMSQLSQSARQTFGQMYRRKFISRVSDLLAQGVAAGEFLALDPMVMTWALLGLMYPYFYAAHADYLGATPEAITQLLNIFFHGVAQPHERGGDG